MSITERPDGTFEGLPDGATVRRITVREPTYGAFRGGDPREFDPDPDCSTDEERAAHAAACAAWDEGRQVESVPGRCLVPVEITEEMAERLNEAKVKGSNFPTIQAGAVALTCTSGAFGLGTYDLEMEALEVTHPDGRVEVYR